MEKKEYMEIFRPKVRWPKIEVDRETCNGCGLCIQNCPNKIPALDNEDKAYMGQDDDCFGCSNCAVACPVDAITIKQTFFIGEEEGFWKTTPTPVGWKVPEPPLDTEGNPTEYTEVENTIFQRRSVRNFKDDPVPETLIRRVIEAGRHAPSAGNCQPWRFIVVTDKSLLDEIGGMIRGVTQGLSAAYRDDNSLEALATQYEAAPQPGMFDPRVQGGILGVAEGRLPVFLNAPAIILLLADGRAIGGTDINIGICGQNMTLAANSFGLGACWVSFSAIANMLPPVKEKLGIDEPYSIISAIALGYPKFKQEGMVEREARPVTWFREGADGPQVE